MPARPLDGPALATATVLGAVGPRGRRAAIALDTAVLLGPRPVWRAARRGRDGGVPGRPARDAVYRRVWKDAADAVGAGHHDLGRGFAELRRAGQVVRVFHQITPLDDPVTLSLALDKPLVHRWLAASGVGVPEHVRFSHHDERPALMLLERTGTCVIKPATGTAGGEGVTAGVRTPADLRRARLRAGAFGDDLLAEHQAPGLLHRILLLDGELLDVIVDGPPHVTGDGDSTVEELIAAENDHRLAARGEAGLELLKLDADLVFALRASGLSLGSVLVAGRRVPVKTVTNDRGPEDSLTYRGIVHDDVLGQARRAIDAIGLRLGGVDVVAPRIDRPLGETGGVVLEVNGTPGIHRHYHVADRGKARRVAEPILERMLCEATTGRVPVGPPGG